MWALAGVQRLRGQGTPVKEWTGRDLCKDQAGLSASLVNAVSGPAQSDWSRRCVPLTRGLRIPWGILCGPLRVSGNSAGKEARDSSLKFLSYRSFISLVRVMPRYFTLFVTIVKDVVFPNFFLSLFILCVEKGH